MYYNIVIFASDADDDWPCRRTLNWITAHSTVFNVNIVFLVLFSPPFYKSVILWLIWRLNDRTNAQMLTNSLYVRTHRRRDQQKVTRTFLLYNFNVTFSRNIISPNRHWHTRIHVPSNILTHKQSKYIYIKGVLYFPYNDSYLGNYLANPIR